MTFLPPAADHTESTPIAKWEMHQPVPLALSQRPRDWVALEPWLPLLLSRPQASSPSVSRSNSPSPRFSCCSGCGSGIGHTGGLDELGASCACSSSGSGVTTRSPCTSGIRSHGGYGQPLPAPPPVTILPFSQYVLCRLTAGSDDVAPTSLGDHRCTPLGGDLQPTDFFW